MDLDISKPPGTGRTGLALTLSLGLAAAVAGCDGGDTSNAAPQSALASPRSEINGNPAQPNYPPANPGTKTDAPAPAKGADPSKAVEPHDKSS